MFEETKDKMKQKSGSTLIQRGPNNSQTYFLYARWIRSFRSRIQLPESMWYVPRSRPLEAPAPTKATNQTKFNEIPHLLKCSERWFLVEMVWALLKPWTGKEHIAKNPNSAMNPMQTERKKEPKHWYTAQPIQ